MGFGGSSLINAAISGSMETAVNNSIESGGLNVPRLQDFVSSGAFRNLLNASGNDLAKIFSGIPAITGSLGALSSGASSFAIPVSPLGILNKAIINIAGIGAISGGLTAEVNRIAGSLITSIQGQIPGFAGLATQLPGVLSGITAQLPNMAGQLQSIASGLTGNFSSLASGVLGNLSQQLPGGITADFRNIASGLAGQLPSITGNLSDITSGLAGKFTTLSTGGFGGLTADHTARRIASFVPPIGSLPVTEKALFNNAFGDKIDATSALPIAFGKLSEASKLMAAKMEEMLNNGELAARIKEGIDSGAIADIQNRFGEFVNGVTPTLQSAVDALKSSDAGIAAIFDKLPTQRLTEASKLTQPFAAKAINV